jgi:hypothetical protein
VSRAVAPFSGECFAVLAKRAKRPSAGKHKLGQILQLVGGADLRGPSR